MGIFDPRHTEDPSLEEILARRFAPDAATRVVVTP
jgi:hypothetical protein